LRSTKHLLIERIDAMHFKGGLNILKVNFTNVTHLQSKGEILIKGAAGMDVRVPDELSIMEAVVLVNRMKASSDLSMFRSRQISAAQIILPF
jgi:hypothetical protein